MCFQTAEEVLTCPTLFPEATGGPEMLREVLGRSEQPLSSGGCACSVQSWIPAQRGPVPVLPCRAQEDVSHTCPHGITCQGDAPLRDQGTGSAPATLSPLLRLAGRPAGASCSRALLKDGQVALGGLDSKRTAVTAPRVALLSQLLVPEPQTPCCGIFWRAKPTIGAGGGCERCRPSHLAPTASPQGCRHRQHSESGLGTAATKLLWEHPTDTTQVLGWLWGPWTHLWLQALLFLG